VVAGADGGTAEGIVMPRFFRAVENRLDDLLDPASSTSGIGETKVPESV
jgi:hypothetical protein